MGRTLKGDSKQRQIWSDNRLEVHLDHDRFPVGNGQSAEKTKVRSLDVLGSIKRSIVASKAALLCLAHALIIATAHVNGDPKYASYRQGNCIKKPLEDFSKASGVDLSNAGSLQELAQFQEYISEYKIVVFSGLSTDKIIFTGNSVSSKKLYLLYNADTKH